MIKNSVDIISIDNPMELLAVRSNLEWWGIQVNSFWIGQATDLVDIFKEHRRSSEHLLIGGHGSAEGFHLPELDEALEAQQPFSKFMTPDDVRQHFDLDQKIVLSNACMTGTETMAHAFLDAGAKYYIAPQGYPEGHASLFYVLSFYYFLFCNKMTVESAHEKARNQDEETKIFELFK